MSVSYRNFVPTINILGKKSTPNSSSRVNKNFIMSLDCTYPNTTMWFFKLCLLSCALVSLASYAISDIDCPNAIKNLRSIARVTILEKSLLGNISPYPRVVTVTSTKYIPSIYLNCSTSPI